MRFCCSCYCSTSLPMHPYLTDLPSPLPLVPHPRPQTPPFAYPVSIYYGSVTSCASLFTLCLVASFVVHNSIASFVSQHPLCSCSCSGTWSLLHTLLPLFKGPADDQELVLGPCIPCQAVICSDGTSSLSSPRPLRHTPSRRFSTSIRLSLVDHSCLLYTRKSTSFSSCCPIHFTGSRPTTRCLRVA